MLNKIKSEPALVSGFVQAVLGLLLAFGVKLSLEQTGAILAVTAAGLAFIVRGRVVPTFKVDPHTIAGKRNEAGYISWLQALIAVLVVLAILWLVGVRVHVG